MLAPTFSAKITSCMISTVVQNHTKKTTRSQYAHCVMFPSRCAQASLLTSRLADILIAIVNQILPRREERYTLTDVQKRAAK